MAERKIRFSKMHALGNDFMVIDGISQSIPLSTPLIQQWANRHTGIGFDQLLLLEKADETGIDFIYRIFNADGREVAQCGNGARAIAKFIQDQQLSPKMHFTVKTLAGKLELILENQNIRANLGIPHLLQPQPLTYQDHSFTFTCIDIGNPHAVLFVEDLTNLDVPTIGKWVSTHTVFPEGTNVEFVHIDTHEQISLRVYERGVGETFACGSGACAAAIAARHLFSLAETLQVHSPGGQVEVSWAGLEKPVWLSGDAAFVFHGEIALASPSLKIERKKS